MTTVPWGPTVYRDLGEYHQAVAGLRATVDVLAGPLARERFGLAGYPAVMSRALLSGCLADLGQFPEAIEQAQTAIRVAEAFDHPYSVAIGHQSLGNALLLRGDVHEATASMERALTICEQRSLPHNVPSLKARLGHAYVRGGRIGSALPLLAQARTLVMTRTSTPNTSRALMGLAEAHLLTGHVSEATRLAQRAFDLASTSRDRGQRGWVRWLLGEIVARSEQPNVEEAEQHYREALALAEELEMRPLQARCHLGLGKLLQRVGRVGEAQTELSTAVTMLREMGMTYWLPEAEVALGARPGRPPRS